MIHIRAVRISRAGGPDVLELGPAMCRHPDNGEVVVSVAAAGLNRADLLQRRGLYPAPAGVPADVPGLEYAGVVAELGPGVTTLSVGDRVMGIVGGGAMATHLVVHESETVPVPPEMSFTDAAAIPEAFMTAYDAVMLQAGLTAGQTLLVHAVGSGVGTAALQLGLAWGARVVGTSRSREKLERCKALGLEHPVHVDSDGRFAGQVQADVILDGVGASYLAENIKALAPRGRLVLLGTLSGSKGELPIGLLLAKRATIIGTVLRARPLVEKAALAADFRREVLPLFDGSPLRPIRLQPIVDAVLPMERVQEAHRLMESDKSFGKLVLTW